MRRISWLTAIVSLVAALLTAGLIPAYAASAAGGGPATALSLAGGATNGQLTAGQRLWYAFQYAGDGSQVQVDLFSNPSGAVTFSVWTKDNITDWAAGNPENPIGRGTPNDLVNGDPFWSGNFDTPGLYYIAVDNATSAPAAFTINASGSGMSAPANAQQNPAQSAALAAATAAPTAAPTAALTPASAPAPAVAPLPAVPSVPPIESSKQAATQAAVARGTPGSGPANMIPISSGATTGQIAPGQWLWYGFQYPGDASQIQVDVSSNPSGAATFSIWTPRNVTDWGLGYNANPVGNSTPNDQHNGDAFWTGNFAAPGIYYIVVKNDTSAPAAFTINASGSGISAPTGQ
jgi:hypothetical protein